MYPELAEKPWSGTRMCWCVAAWCSVARTLAFLPGAFALFSPLGTSRVGFQSPPRDALWSPRGLWAHLNDLLCPLVAGAYVSVQLTPVTAMFSTASAYFIYI